MLSKSLLFSMLCAKRKSDGQTVNAYFESQRNGPFVCVDCNEEVILKAGSSKINHFAHANPIACKYAEGESDAHRRCKLEIFQALQREPSVRNVALERPLGPVRPDVSAYIRGVPVAIEIQISSLSVETIMHRTIQYAQNGIYVLWLLQWTAELDSDRYAPNVWERWIHATYFGQVYYWVEGLTVVGYHFDPYFKSVPRKSFYSEDGDKITVGWYRRRSKRYRMVVRGVPLNLVKDFGPKQRYWWEGKGIKVPDAKLFMHTNEYPKNDGCHGPFR